MEKKLETTIVYWGYIRIREKKMVTTGHSMSCDVVGFYFGVLRRDVPGKSKG